ncbi:MAG: glycoside hydrolase family 3 N-terminal domain-containing protein [Lachnospiraceae bacterium]|nr:glycoside hydrolase family 3 N-terminal domain-containing protein [Lachnospiraceae bacterium]
MGRNYTVEQKEGFTRYYNEKGPVIGTADAPVIEEDGFIFKDLERTGELIPYEDWRLDDDTRAKDLASRLSIEEIAGLMMYSPHQMVPAYPGGPFTATYDGKTFPESGKKPWEMSDQQKKFLEEDHVRHVLLMLFESAGTAARWNNEMQRYVEALPHGIPINFSSDPRHGAGSASAEYKSQAGQVSRWPEGLAMAATFSPEICRQYAEIVAKEYRALGITTALSPQIDLGTEPRWMRVEDTFGPDPELVTRMGRAYCDGLQTTEGSPDGWGTDSVCAMVKHWPGGGPCEGGRDAHYAYGKFAVYPGGCLEEHLKPFTEGAFHLDGPTGQASAVMPYYTVSWNVDQKDGQNVGNSYSHYLIHDLLREKYGYEGVICTDWGITGDPDPELDSFGSRCYGVEHLSEAERHLRIIENGVDQFGGNDKVAPILEAYRMGCEKYGEEAMRRRMEESAVRLLKNFFRCGLFENPYLDPQESEALVGCREHQEAGFAAQLKSVVMLKNHDALPMPAGKKVYIPDRFIKARKNFFRMPEPEKRMPGASREIVSEFYSWAETPEEADFALVFIESPLIDGYREGYQPISLQYRPYHAEEAREKSIAGGDFRESSDNRSYRGKWNQAANESDLDLVIDTKKRMGDKPVIVCVRVHNPMVFAELEPYADAIFAEFGVQQEAILNLVSGKAEPRGRLPVQMPADMKTVELHCEDRPFDLEPYTDSDGNRYDYGFGLGWKKMS